jgi:hypothetical protein
MPPANLQALLQQQLEIIATATEQEQALNALIQYFHARLSACAEEVIDEEMAPINGTPFTSPYADRPDSSYFAYNTAKRHAYAGFSEEQRQILRGLVQHTAFEMLQGIFCTLADISEHEVSIQLRPKVKPELVHDLCARSPDHGNYYWSEDIPAAVSKYEY